jgi:maltooligosyltrehalose trehalohydrolase
MLDWYKQLITLRKSHPELTDGSLKEMTVEYSEDEKWLAMRRGSLEIVVNLKNHRCKGKYRQHRSWYCHRVQ